MSSVRQEQASAGAQDASGLPAGAAAGATRAALGQQAEPDVRDTAGISRICPRRITRYTQWLAWINLALNILIVITGGLVRLTKSGLGCSTWPLCTPESFTPRGEDGIHGLIEFGNRTMSGWLAVAALLLVIATWRTRGTGARVFWPSVVVGIGVLLQAVVGGVIVWLHLTPNLVAFHFLVSLVLVGVCAYLVWQVTHPYERRERLAPRQVSIVAHIMTALLFVTLIIGVLTTGSGPHAGDDLAARNGLDPAVMQHVHSWPAYALFAAVVVLVMLAYSLGARRTAPWTLALLATLIVQIGLGIWQSNAGLPIWVVAFHMLISAIALALGVAVVMSLKGDPERLAEQDANAIHSA